MKLYISILALFFVAIMSCEKLGDNDDSGGYKAPDFESREMFVDWVKLVPFNQPNDDFFE